MQKWFTKNIVGFSLASFFNDFCHEMVTSLLPSFINSLVGPFYAPTALGLIQGISDAASTIMKLLSGFLADRVHSYKPFLIVGYGLTTIVALIGTATSAWSVLFYKTIAWMARGIREPMRDTWLTKIIPPQFYGRAFGFQRACDTLGALLGPLCAYVLLQLNVPVRSILLLSFIPGIISIIPIIFLTNQPKEHAAAKPSLPLFATLKKLPTSFNHFILVMFLFGVANFNQALLLYRAQEVMNNNTGTSSIITTGWVLIFYSLFNLIRGMSEFGIGALSDYYNRKNLLALFGFGFFSLSCLGCIVPSPNLLLWFLIFACAGLSAGTVKTLEKAHAATLLPEAVRGTGFGILQTVDGIGDLLSSVIVGILWSFFSPQIGFTFAITISIISMLMLLGKK